jgi:hypothetical protein
LGLKGDIMEIGDIIQITDEKDKWYPCLLVVDGIKPWGVQAYALIPNNNGDKTDTAYYRIEYKKFEKVGTTVVFVFDE